MGINESETWEILQREAKRMAKEELLEALLKATGLDEYIASAIARHEEQNHD